MSDPSAWAMKRAEEITGLNEERGTRDGDKMEALEEDPEMVIAHALDASRKELVEALRPFVVEALEKFQGRIEDEDWNPDFHVEMTVSVAEIRRAVAAIGDVE